MVKKLLKHEFSFYLKITLLVDIILFSIALFTRIVQFFESESVIYSIINFSSIAALVVAMAVALVLTTVMIVVRFYSNMYSREGYLSFTLPVTNAQHIFSKLICAVAFEFLTYLAVFIAGIIATAGDVCAEIFKAVFYLSGKYFEFTGIHGGLYIFEFLLLLLVSAASGCLLLYTCMTIGQLAKKGRIIMSIVVYYIYTVIIQVISTSMSILFSVATYKEWPILNRIGEFVLNHPFASVHIFLITLIVFTLILAVVFYAITHKIMSKKLNLE